MVMVDNSIKLFRVAQSDEGTFGVIVHGQRPICCTVEDPWNDNKKRISCIPEGEYTCVKHDGAHWSNVWELLDVPGRDAILIHSGNTIDDTMGCILVGDKHGKVNGKYGVLNSSITLNYLRSKLPDTFKIRIINTVIKGSNVAAFKPLNA